MFAHACPSARRKSDALIRAMALEVAERDEIPDDRPFRFSDYDDSGIVSFYDEGEVYGARLGDGVLVVDNEVAHIFAAGVPDRLGGESTCVYAGAAPDDPEELLHEWQWEVEDRFERERLRLNRFSVVSMSQEGMAQRDLSVIKWFSSPDMLEGIGAAKMGDHALLVLGRGYHRQRFKVVVGPESFLLYRGTSHRPADDPYRWDLCWESLLFEECLDYAEHPDFRAEMEASLVDSILRDNREYGEMMGLSPNSYLRFSKGSLSGHLEYPDQTLTVVDWSVTSTGMRRSLPSLFQIV